MLGEPDPVSEWGQEIRDYHQSKTQLQFAQPFEQRVRHADMKASENAYNPILQKYSDSNLEK